MYHQTHYRGQALPTEPKPGRHYWLPVGYLMTFRSNMTYELRYETCLWCSMVHPGRDIELCRGKGKAA